MPPFSIFVGYMLHTMLVQLSSVVSKHEGVARGNAVLTAVMGCNFAGD